MSDKKYIYTFIACNDERRIVSRALTGFEADQIGKGLADYENMFMVPLDQDMTAYIVRNNILVAVKSEYVQPNVPLPEDVKLPEATPAVTDEVKS